MPIESTLWSAPLVYRASGSTHNRESETEGTDGVGRLTATALHLSDGQSVALETCAGAEVSSEGCQWILHSYLVQTHRYRYTPYLLECPNAIATQEWVDAVNSALVRARSPIRPSMAQGRSLTVLLNPNSGNKRSAKIWREIEPIFSQTGYPLNVIQTQSAEDLREQARALDLQTCVGLIVLGGDGSIHHAVNGLMTHPDSTQAIQLPLGFIPTGTSNGLVKSILDAVGFEYSVQNAAIAIVLGKTRALDLIQVTQPHLTYFSVLSLSWGFFSDIDIESDRLKGLGFLKNYLYTLFRLITYRTYSGQVELKTDSGWQILSLDLITLWTMNVAWAAYNFKPAPEAMLNDVSFDVWITPRSISRWAFLWVLLQAFDGNHLKLKGVNYHKVQGLKVIPNSAQGIFAIDGEPVPYTPIELAVYPKPLTIFAPQAS